MYKEQGLAHGQRWISLRCDHHSSRSRPSPSPDGRWTCAWSGAAVRASARGGRAGPFAPWGAGLCRVGASPHTRQRDSDQGAGSWILCDLGQGWVLFVTGD